MKYIFCLFWIIVIIIGVTFTSLNPGMVKINYYISESTLHLPVLLLIMIAIGALLGMIAILPALLRSKRTNRRLRQRIKQTDLEINNLRTMPVKEVH